MSELKRLSTENVQFALEQLSGYEPDDIECDDIDIAVNDDQFATMSIVRLAQLGAERIAEQSIELEKLRSLVEAAFREGYSLGYMDGNSDGQSYAGRPCRDDDGQWVGSDSIEELAKLSNSGDLND